MRGHRSVGRYPIQLTLDQFFLHLQKLQSQVLQILLDLFLFLCCLSQVLSTLRTGFLAEFLCRSTRILDCEFQQRLQPGEFPRQLA